MNRTRNIWKSVIYIFTASLFITSCNEPGDVGMELLPSSDLVSVGNVVIKDEIKAFTVIDDSVSTDEAAFSLLGSMNDPVFGITSIDLALQLRLSSFPDFGTDPVVDSIKFYFYYNSVYGDTATTQRLKFYELTSSIDPDARYYDNVDLAQLASTTPLAEYNFKPKVALDSIYKDTLYQLVEVHLDHSLAQKLINADSLDMINNEVFLEYFKGLYIQSEQVDAGGAIVSLDLLPTSSFEGSGLVLYYRNDTVKKSKTYFVTSFSARVNSFKHDYTQTAFYPNMNQETVTDTLIYVQSTGGLQSKIFIPGLESWKDSSNIAVNKAELIFQVDTTASEFRKYPLPSQLLLTYISKTGQETLPRDHSFYQPYYGGYLYNDFTYRFNITQHFQSIIDGENDNNGFYLTPYFKNNQIRRAVLKGSNSDQGIKFVITYSKLLQ